MQHDVIAARSHGAAAARSYNAPAASTVALLCLTACSGFPKSGPPPGPLSVAAVQVAQTRFPTATAESLEGGRQLFLRNCNQCHRFPALGAYSDVQWQRIVASRGNGDGLKFINLRPPSPEKDRHR